MNVPLVHQRDIAGQIIFNGCPNFGFHLQVTSDFGGWEHFREFFGILPPHNNFRTFRFERLETNPRFATIARQANATIIVTLRVDMEDRGGRIELMIPYATLEPIRELLLQMFMGEKFGRDSIWEGHLTSELWQTEVAIHAVLDQIELPLSSILEWEEGCQLDLNCTPQSLVELKCGGMTMFRGRMGQRNGSISVQVCEKAPVEEDQS